MMVMKVSDTQTIQIKLPNDISNAIAFGVLAFTVYNCQGSWTDNTTTFIVAKHSGSHHSVCISYQPTDAPNVRLFVGDTCYRSIPLQTTDHHLAANLTVVGKCIFISSSFR